MKWNQVMLNKTLFTLFIFIFTASAFAKGNRWQGVPFPQFELADQNKAVKNNKNFNNKWVIYYFYPKDKTPGCTTEAKEFAKAHTKLNSMNTEIVGISYDDSDSHKDFAEIYDIKFTLLADIDHKLTKKLDVDSLFPWPHPSRQTFLVNPKGNIVKHYENVDPDIHAVQLIKDITLLQKETDIL